MPKTTVNTVEAKNNLNSLIAQVERDKTPIIIEKRGTPVAVIWDYQTYREKNPMTFGVKKKSARDPGRKDFFYTFYLKINCLALPAYRNNIFLKSS
jgi:prevent-host-death family protein